MQDDTKGMLYGLVGVTAFGFTLPATKLVIPFVDPIFIGLGRAIVAGVFAAFILFWFRAKFPTFKQMQHLLVIALGVVVGFPVLSSWAMQHVPASHGGVVLGILPLSTAVMSVFIGGERPSVAFWLMSIIGSGLVIAYALLQGAGQIHVADAALLGAVLSAAIGYSIGAKLSKELGGWQVICWALVIISPFIIIPTLYAAPHSFSAISVDAYLAFIYLALVSQLLAFFVWYKGLALGGIARVSQVQLLQPFITLLASMLLLQEAIDAATVVFIVLVVCSVWLGKRMPIVARRDRPEQLREI